MRASGWKGGRLPAATLVTLMMLTAGVEAAAPYPASQFLTKLTLDWGTFRRHAEGSDNWPLTWAANGRTYTAWGDGGGFRPTGQRPKRVSIGVASITGSDAASVRGGNIIGGANPSAATCMKRFPGEKQDYNPGHLCHRVGRHGKSYGALALGDQLYLWIVPGSKPADMYSEARLYKARQGTNAWQRASWAFTPSGALPVVQPTFMQAGRDHGDIADYVYVYANRHAPIRMDTLDVQRGPGGGQTMLMRARKGADLMRRDSWMYLAGVSSSGAASWTADPAKARPAHANPEGVGWTVSAIYAKSLGRYLLMTEHGASKNGLLGVFESRNPWGPWRTVFYGRVTDGTKRVPPTGFHYNFLPQGFRDGGRSFTLSFTGILANDALNLVNGRFTVNEAHR